MVLSIRKVQLISTIFLLVWIVGLLCCWRNIFHSYEEKELDIYGLYQEGRRPSVEMSNHSNVRKHKKKRKHVIPPINLPLPVIVVGFPKAGTSSLFSFFSHQGFNAQHWYCCKKQINPQKGGPSLMSDCILYNLGLMANKSNEKSMLQGCGDFEVYAEINGPRSVGTDGGFLLEDGTYDMESPGPRIFLPQHFNLQQLHEEYPNATWILNLRDSKKWSNSVMKWSDLKDQFANEYFMQHQIYTIPKNDTEMSAFLRNIYDEHSELIRNFVRKHPSHRLIQVNIEDNDNAGKILAEAFGLQKQHWPHKNRSPVWWRKRSLTFIGRILQLLPLIFLFTTAYLVKVFCFERC